MDITSQFAARQVKTQVQIGDVTIPVNGITMMHVINSLPYVELSVQLDNTDAMLTNIAKIKPERATYVPDR